MKRRVFIQAPAALITATSLGSAALAQGAFPNKPIRFVVPTSAGSVTDAVARAYGEHMARTLKQPVVLEHLPGAGTLLGMRAVLKAPADGYTLSVSSNTIVTLPHLNKSAGYSGSDFLGVSNLAKSPMALVVSAQSPYHTLADLVAAAKKAPGMLTFGSVGIGTTSHIPVELFAQSAGIKLQLVPYKGIPLAIPDVVSERVTMMIGTSPTVGELIKSGKMRALALTSDARSSYFPNTPTFAEAGHGEATYDFFLGLMGLATTPPAIVKVLSDAAELAKKDPEVRKRLEALGQELPSQTSSEQFTAFLRKEEVKMAKVVKDANIQVAN